MPPLSHTLALDAPVMDIVSLGLRSGFESPDLERPGRLPHKQGLREARLGYRDGSPQLGGPGPGLERAGRHQGIHVMWSCKQKEVRVGERGRTGAGAVDREGEVGNGRGVFAWCLKDIWCV